MTTDEERRIDVRSRKDIRLRMELAFSRREETSSETTFWARGCISGLLGMIVPAENDKSSRKTSRSFANLSKALSKSKSFFFCAASLRLCSVTVELLDVELFRTSSLGVLDLDVGCCKGPPEPEERRLVGEEVPVPLPLL